MGWGRGGEGLAGHLPRNVMCAVPNKMQFLISLCPLSRHFPGLDATILCVEAERHVKVALALTRRQGGKGSTVRGEVSGNNTVLLHHAL